MRAFIAITLPHAVRAALWDLSRRLQASGGRVSWVRPEHMHLTLRFLGDISEEQGRALTAFLADAYLGMARFSLTVQGTGAFPNARKPSVIWVGFEPVAGGLDAVQQTAESAARAIGLPPEEKPFRPHLTLARIRDARTVRPLMDDFDQEQDFRAGEFIVTSVSLFSSELTPKGPIHTRLQEFVLC